MADFVRHVLEDMVPELEDLENRGYFSRPEIKQIVQKRQDFEYNLRRRAALKADFLRCIDYEMALERLRQLRRKERAIGGPSTLADHCIVRRIHFIYERMLRKFRGDLALWSHWLAFCQRSKSSRQTSKVLTRALKLHPVCPALWTYAASWEFESNGNATAARALMQRGLRMCKEEPELWHEYFRMELLYAARLVARRNVLGLSGTADATQDAAAEVVLKGGVAKVVYTNAVAALPKSLAFRAGFLKVLAGVSLPGKEDLEGHILDDIARAFAGMPGAVNLEARRRMHEAELQEGATVNAVNSALTVFQAALDTSSSPRLWDVMLEFIEEQVQRALSSKDALLALKLVEKCLEIVEGAVKIGHANDRVLLTWTRANLRLGQLGEAIEASTGSGGMIQNGPIPSAAMREAISLQATASALQVGGPQNPGAMMKDLMNGTLSEGRRPAEIWLCAVRIATAWGLSLHSLADAFISQQRGCVHGPVKGGMGVAAACLFSAMWTLEGCQCARGLYQSLFALSMPGGELVHAVLDAELAWEEARCEDALSLRQLRRIFESGVTVYGRADVELWLRFLQFEQQRQGGKNAGAVHWRAVKALDNADAFVARAQLKNLGMP